MDASQERLLQLERDLLADKSICSSAGTLPDFPLSLKSLFRMKGLGLVVCQRGSFQFMLNQQSFAAQAGEMLFIPEEAEFRVTQVSQELEMRLLVYRIDPIRDIIGNSVASMYMYSQLTPGLCCVWSTGEEDDFLRYMSLIDNVMQMEENTFSLYEKKLLLLGLTYRICSIYHRKLITAGQDGEGKKTEAGGRKNEIFIRLIELIEKYYMKERSVEFYADKLCLSPKYLSAISKSVCGYTVQELVFKAIIRKSISLLKNTQKDVQEISNLFGFPNASYFGTFFKKQMGMSPQQYRKQLK